LLAERFHSVGAICARTNPRLGTPKPDLGQHGEVPQARYDGLADWYEDWASGFVRPFAPVLAARVVEFVDPGSTVLDVGCGTGLHFGALQALKLHPLGVDISADQLGVHSSTERESATSAGSSFDPAMETPSDGSIARQHHAWPARSAHAISPLPRSSAPSLVPD
jgi:SAM-dependent methyltransferase